MSIDGYGNVFLNLIITMVVYMCVPLILRLSRENAYLKKEASKISLINSIIVSFVFFLLRELSGSISINSISVPVAVIYYFFNLSVLQWNIKPRNYSYLFMFLSIILCVSSWFYGALLFSFIAFCLSFGGLRLSIIKGSWQRKILYLEVFVSLYMFFTYLHGITINIGIAYAWGIIYATILMIMLHFLLFKNQVMIKECNDKDYRVDEKKLKKVLYCKLCGAKLNEDKICTKCGKQYFKFNYKVLSIILGIVVLILSGLCVYFYSLYDESIEVYSEYVVDNLSDKIDLQEELDSINGDRSTYWTKEKLNFLDENIVFVIEGYGDYYYTYNCMVDNIDGEYTYWAYNKEQAIYKGYKEGKCR